jgi:hypothetical protein
VFLFLGSGSTRRSGLLRFRLGTRHEKLPERRGDPKNHPTRLSLFTRSSRWGREPSYSSHPTGPSTAKNPEAEEVRTS